MFYKTNKLSQVTGRRGGFTIVELLVVIAIIGVISALVITQLGSARVKSRNATAKSDVIEAGQAIEAYKANTEHDNLIISHVNEGGDIITGGTGVCSACDLFSGAESSEQEYPLRLVKTPSENYLYNYITNDEAIAPREAEPSKVSYLFSVRLADEENGAPSGPFFWVRNGEVEEGTALGIP